MTNAFILKIEENEVDGHEMACCKNQSKSIKLQLMLMMTVSSIYFIS